jgi:uncharacterized membrane protein YebE (DUF533 family)
LLGGRRGSFLNASTLLAAAGVGWGLLESVRRDRRPRVQEGTTWVPSEPGAPPAASATRAGAPAAPAADVPPEVLRIVRLSVSAARADGVLSAAEREKLLAEARAAGLEALVRAELDRPAPLASIAAGLGDEKHKRELYTLAFAIVRADEGVSGAERVYLAQLAHLLGLDAAAAASIEQEAAAKIDGARA